MTTAIGVHAQAAPERLQATVEAVRRHTTPGFELWILADGREAMNPTVAERLGAIRQIATDETRGAPVCFNRFASECDAETIVLLESGVLVGPGWLDALLAALTADPRNGLAGSSTNRSWNEQAAFPHTRATDEAIAQAARAARERFAAEWRTLEPLHSLADFCYAVRREVFDAIGPADEGYGDGPCWEMDYNIRAARAGWRGVWACASYVHRLPFTGPRREAEARLFEASKRRYQDKFCGARLRGLKHDFRPHCRGDACPNFAPIEFASRWRSAPAPTSPEVSVEAPLVTCIMPTCDRPWAIAGAIRGFLRQDYPRCELLIVDDGREVMQDRVPVHSRIRYVRLREKMILGEKRNFACAEARGEIIAHWDDDDWYPPDRVRRQVEAMNAASAPISGTSRLYYYDAPGDRAWLYRYRDGARAWVGGNTLAYRRAFWERHRFPRVQVGEDTRFVWADASAAVCDLKDPALCIARVHTGNTSRKQTRGSCWASCASDDLRRLLGAEVTWFRGAAALPDNATPPLISCITPTRNRRAFLELSLRWFLAQDYPHREWIVVDDGDDDVADLFRGVENVRHLRVPAGTSIGAKRNRACTEARGALIAHWDDDDWYAPRRLSQQAGPILAGDADLTGLHTCHVLMLESGKFFSISPALHARMFFGNVHGGTLLFRRAVFESGIHYPPINLAEDAAFLNAAMRRGQRLVRLQDPDAFVYVRHGSNAWRFLAGQFLDPGGWAPSHGPAAISPWLPDYRECHSAAKR